MYDSIICESDFYGTYDIIWFELCTTWKLYCSLTIIIQCVVISNVVLYLLLCLVRLYSPFLPSVTRSATRCERTLWTRVSAVRFDIKVVHRHCWKKAVSLFVFTSRMVENGDV